LTLGGVGALVVQNQVVPPALGTCRSIVPEAQELPVCRERWRAAQVHTDPITVPRAYTIHEQPSETKWWCVALVVWVIVGRPTAVSLAQAGLAQMRSHTGGSYWLMHQRAWSSALHSTQPPSGGVSTARGPRSSQFSNRGCNWTADIERIGHRTGCVCSAHRRRPDPPESSPIEHPDRQAGNSVPATPTG